MTPDRLLTLKETCEQAGISASLVYGLMRAAQFPAQIHIGVASRWSEREVQAWIAAQIQRRDERRTA